MTIFKQILDRFETSKDSLFLIEPKSDSKITYGELYEKSLVKTSLYIDLVNT